MQAGKYIIQIFSQWFRCTRGWRLLSAYVQWQMFSDYSTADVQRFSAEMFTNRVVVITTFLCN